MVRVSLREQTSTDAYKAQGNEGWRQLPPVAGAWGDAPSRQRRHVDEFNKFRPPSSLRW